MRHLARLEGWLRGLERAWLFVAGAAVFVVMIVAIVDVGRRYLINAPLTWAYDFISLYLMAALFFLALADTFRKDHHVRVDLLAVRMPWRLRSALEAATLSLALVVFLAIFWEGLRQAVDSFVAGDVLATVIPWPTWAYRIFVPLGVGLLILRLALNIGTIAVATALGRKEIADVVAGQTGQPDPMGSEAE